MALSSGSDFVNFICPLKERLSLYDPSRRPYDQPRNDAAGPTRSIPHGFIDAMEVRAQVFVDEQKIPLEKEMDEDDQRSFHWVAYASVSDKGGRKASGSRGAEDEKAKAHRRTSTSTKVPIGTIRVVPPRHGPHPNDVQRTAMHDGVESYVKFSRLAVVPEFRKTGISSLLFSTALAFVRERPDELMPSQNPLEMLRQQADRGANLGFKGLCHVHSPKGAQKVWKKYGFEVDPEMGTWQEEGIEHVGMWMRIDVSRGRRKSKPWISGSGGRDAS